MRDTCIDRMLSKRPPEREDENLYRTKLNPLTQEEYSFRYGLMSKTRKKLPIWQHSSTILAALAKSRVVLIKGETGCGKSTQIVHMLLEASLQNKKLIGIVNSREIFLKNLSNRISLELDVSLGFEVCYSLELERKLHPSMSIHLLSYQILVQEAVKDPHFLKYSVIVLDDVHEKDLYFQATCELLTAAMERNNHLRVVLLTSLLDSKFLEDLFPQINAVKIPGVLHPVEIRYYPKELNYKQSIQATVDTIISIVLFQEEGNILTFLSSDQDFNYFLSVIKSKLCYFFDDLGPIQVTFIYSDYVSKGFCQEQEILNGKNASTKPTRSLFLLSSHCEYHQIKNIRFVVDCGWEVRKVWYWELSHSVDVPHRVSKHEANSRALVCGQKEGAVCFRIYPKGVYLAMGLSKKPELEYKDLTKLVLLGSQLQTQHGLSLASLPVTSANWRSAEKYLQAVGALDGSGRITALGSFIVSLPVCSALGKVVFEAVKSPLFFKILDCLSVLSCPGIMPKHFEEESPGPCGQARRLHSPAQQEEPSEEQPAEGFIEQLSVRQKRHLMINLLYTFEDYERQVDNRLKWCLGKNLAYRYLEKALTVRDCIKSCVLRAALEPAQPDLALTEGQRLEKILECLLLGLFPQTALKQPGDCFVLRSLDKALDPLRDVPVIQPYSPILYGELTQVDGLLEVNYLQLIRPADVGPSSPLHALLNGKPPEDSDGALQP